MTRDEARALFAASGLDYSVLTAENLRRLIACINEAMKASGSMRGTFRMLPGLGLRGPSAAFLRCKSDYFTGREAVSFNADGFIGFAGWADNKNVQPILSGFARWVEEMAALQQSQAA